MSGNEVADHSQSWQMQEIFRFSPRANSAHKIRWRPWCRAAFQEAMLTDKPILLVITSSWCHWCHTMDETTLSDSNIIKIINADYIPIRVDSDMRPDVNARYNQNGWPSVAMLSAEGEVLWGGVYVPPKQMLYYLGYVRRYYSEHRQELALQVQQLQAQRDMLKEDRNVRKHWLRPLSQEEQIALKALPEQAGHVLRDLYDADYGGFTIHPRLKFPHPEALELLLHLARRGQSDCLEMVCYSLQQMRDGGLWDKESGGFFRYSAASDWGAPHTEKMAEENAALLHVIAQVTQETGDYQWYQLLQQLVFYCNTTLWQPREGVFSGSQSADEEYYEPGPYSRATRLAPHVDTAIYTVWNARMASAYLLASRVLNQPSLNSMALRSLDWLCQKMIHREGSVYHYALHDQKGLPGQLADQVWMTRALLDAYEIHGNKTHLETAVALMHFCCQSLLDEHNGLFYDYPETADAVGRLLIREQSLTENALAAECLLRMAAYSKRQNLRDTALLVLSGCLEKYKHTGIQGAIYASVVASAVARDWL